MNHAYATLAVEYAQLHNIRQKRAQALEDAKRDLQLVEKHQDEMSVAIQCLGYDPEIALQYGQEELV